MRCHWIAVLALLAPAPDVRAEVVLPKASGDSEATLTVSVAEPDASKPNQVCYMVRVVAPAGVEVNPPEIVDGAQAWKWEVPAASRSAPASWFDVREAWTYSIDLEQTKPGTQPLPGVKVRVHPRGQDGGEEFVWTDVLKDLRQLAPPAEPVKPPAPPTRSLLWWGLALGALLSVALGVSVWLLRGKKPAPPLTPAQWALNELDRIERLGLAGPDETGWFPAELSGVVRRFLSERYGLPAPQQTTAEFLHTMRNTPDLSDELRQTVKDLLERCDLAKFAALRTPPDECRRLAALARSVVEQTTVPKAPAPVTN
jgi:hypothetical protein